MVIDLVLEMAFQSIIGLSVSSFLKKEPCMKGNSFIGFIKCKISSRGTEELEF